MQRRNAFTLIELLVVISIIALLIGILLPALGAARKTARQLASNTQIRGIHQSMVVFSQENKTGGRDGYFPGLAANGRLAELPAVAGSDAYWMGGAGTTACYGSPKHRYALLFNGNYITPEYATSPADSNVVEATAGAMNSDHFSYAMNSLGGGVWGYATVNTAFDADYVGRVYEWKETLNSSAPVMGDMNTGSNIVDPGVSSWWTEENSGAWQGGIAFNDNSVSLETSNFVDNTRFAEYTAFANDNIFNRETSVPGDTGRDAFFVLGRVEFGHQHDDDGFRQ